MGRSTGMRVAVLRSMPPAEQIVASLSALASSAFAVGVLWHGVAAVIAFALWRGWRPRARDAAALLALPLASVAALAWWAHNPFNGAAFSLLAAALGVLGRRAPRERVSASQGAGFALGLALSIFGWVYPHFLAERSALAYLYGAPLGVVPCPTLAAICGAALLGRGLARGAWALVLAGAAAFYAALGVFRLGVMLDVGLLAGALGLGAQVARERRARRGAGAVVGSG